MGQFGRWLGPERQRPRRSGGAEQDDEFPSPHGFTRAEDCIGQQTKYHIFGLRIVPLVTSERATAMSAFGQKRTSQRFTRMSALPPKADMDWHSNDVCFVPKADIIAVPQIATYSISSSASDRNDAGIVSPSVLEVVRLMTKSNLVSRSTGRSLGLAPLRIRPT